METDVYNYLRDNIYPKGYSEDDKRKLRSKSKKYAVNNNKLFWMNHNNQLREVLMNKYDINSILHIFHVGMEKTYAAIAELYYWNNIHESIEDYSKSCDECQRLGTVKKDDTELHPIPVISPWYHVGMDLVKMPISKSGNKYILTSMDYFKKWPHAVAIRDKLAETIASAL